MQQADSTDLPAALGKPGDRKDTAGPSNMESKTKRVTLLTVRSLLSKPVHLKECPKHQRLLLHQLPRVINLHPMPQLR